MDARTGFNVFLYSMIIIYIPHGVLLITDLHSSIASILLKRLPLLAGHQTGHLGVLRPDGGQHYRQQHQPVEQSEHADHEEDLEEGDKYVGAGGGEEGEGEDGGEAAVHHGRSNVLHHVDNALVARALAVQEAVDDVRAEVDAEADANDEDAHRGYVDRQAPPVHET